MKTAFSKSTVRSVSVLLLTLLLPVAFVRAEDGPVSPRGEGTPVLGSLAPTNGTAGTPYTGSIPISGGTTPYSLVSTTGLPTGLNVTISGNNVSITGTPTQSVDAANNLSVTVKDSGNISTSRTYTLVISCRPRRADRHQRRRRNQSATVNTNVAIAPSVVVKDIYGNVTVSGEVDYVVVSGGGSVTGTPAFSDQNGIARVGSWRLGTVAGTNTLTATLNTNSPDVRGTLVTSVTFTAAGTAGPAAQIAKSAGDNQTASFGRSVAIPPSVIVTDFFGNVVSGTTINFVVASGGGSVTGASPSSNASGIATVGSWTLGPTTGTNTLTASLGKSPEVREVSLVTSVTFTATAVNLPPIIDSAMASPPNPAPNQPVTILVSAHDPENQPLTTTFDFGDGTGTGSSPTHIYTVPGTYTVKIFVSDGTNTTEKDLTLVVGSNEQPRFRGRIEMTLFPVVGGEEKGKDMITLHGNVHLFNGQEINGSSLTLNIGGNVKTFILNGNGHGVTDNATIQIEVQKVNGAVIDQEALFTAVFKHGGYAASIFANGGSKPTVRAPTSEFPTHVLCTLIFNEETLFADIPLKFKTIPNGGIRTVGINSNAN